MNSGMIIHLFLPVPPSANKRLKRNHRLTDEASTYLKTAAWEAQTQMLENGWGMLTGELRVHIYYFGTRLDWDNGNKLLCDSLNGVVWSDDKLITEAHVYMKPKDKAGRRVELFVGKQ